MSSADEGSANGSNPEESNPLYPRFKEVNEKYGKLKWAEAYDDPEQVSRSVALSRWASDDPKGFHAFLTSQLRAHGILTDDATANARREPQGPPQPDRIDPATGDKYYSAARAEELLQYHIGQLQGSFDKRLGPVEQFLGSARVNMQARNEAQGLLADARKNWPHFKDHEPAIFQAMKANPRLSFEGAYRSVVIPALENRTRQDTLDAVEQKPGATTHSPASASGGGREDLSKLPLKDLVRREMRKRGMGR